GNPRELAGALRSNPSHRKHHPFRMMDALGVAGDLGADHASRVGLLLRTADAANAAALDHFDIERAGRRAIVRTGGVADLDLGALVHDQFRNTKIPDSRG